MIVAVVADADVGQWWDSVYDLAGRSGGTGVPTTYGRVTSTSAMVVDTGLFGVAELHPAHSGFGRLRLP